MASGADRISDLPEGVLHHILSLLPAEDAVRTCVLAKSWRNRWRSAPAVRFVCSTDTAADINVFATFVEGLLRVRRGGPPLDSCDFDVDVGDVDEFDFDLNKEGHKWICSVLELKVRELRFQVSYDPDNVISLDVYSLKSQHLTSLELTGAQHDEDVIFRECPALESLKLEGSHVWSMEMDIPSLKHLSIKDCLFHAECRISMRFPNLVSFELIDNSGRAPMLEAMPYLETAKVEFDDDFDDRCTNGRLDDCGDAACPGCFSYYEVYDDDCDGSCSVLLHGLAEATYLNLSAYPDMYVFNRDLKWCPAFNKLKTLVLSKWFLSTDLSALIWFLNHAPLLEKLTLEIPKPRKTLMKTEGSYNPFEKSIAPSHLQSVEIISKDVDGIVFKVLKVLNANGIPLGKIRIQCAGCYDFVCTNINSM